MAAGLGRRHSVACLSSSPSSPQPLPTVSENGSRTGTPSASVRNSNIFMQAGQHVIPGAKSLDDVVSASPSPMKGGRRGSMMAMSCGGNDLKTLLGLDESKVSASDAEQQLLTAIESGDTGSLLAAILQAKESHVDREHIQAATKRLQSLESESALKRAVKAENPDAIKDALERAKAAGVGRETMQAARQHLDILEKEEKLRLAMSLQDRDCLNWALENAAEGARKDTLDQAMKVLAKLDELRAVTTAMRTKDPRKIQSAITVAINSGASEADVEDAKQLIKKLKDDAEKKKPTPVKGEGGQIDSRALEMLQTAVKMGEIGPLKMAIRQAQDAGGLGKYVEDAKRVLAHIESQKALVASFKNKDQSKLRTALRDAIAAAAETEFEGPELQQAKVLLAQLEAVDGLAKATKRGEADDLEEAIEKARSLNVDKKELDRAEKALDKLKSSGASPAAAAPKAVLRRSSTGGVKSKAPNQERRKSAAAII